ncbi:MAG: hypothetical protein AAFV87_18990, partial [Pseudomonadota bacterium]
VINVVTRERELRRVVDWGFKPHPKRKIMRDLSGVVFGAIVDNPSKLALTGYHIDDTGWYS